MQYQQPFSTPHPGSIQIDYLDVLNYSLLHNHVASVHACSIRNDSDVAWQRVSLRLSGDFVHPSEVVLTEVPAGQEGSLPEKELFRLASKELGFARTGSRIRDRLCSALEHLVATGQVASSKDLYALASA